MKSINFTTSARGWKGWRSNIRPYQTHSLRLRETFATRRRYWRYWSRPKARSRSEQISQSGKRKNDGDLDWFLIFLTGPVPNLTRHALRSEERRVGKECRSRWSSRQW